ncbi:fumarylacetoacetate hydrolase family protein [Sphingomonas sp. BIUV-7]|uniref:Fumarylacetoacetate hydrolase family protein n=1 Tax=Sphingomonas natans TaxID=3063330 RepID=A0ABT8YAF5_9SPHN|nr:fumarylacetoacetate hydrolase family protein [Sphingomonas sp. BIUV-7]MDO6415324.1 fumarylacetoacetate hydrolase family protein [Sphingomonas sp. BIUV-7]
MRLATLHDGSPDGRLVLVSDDHARILPGPVATLQQALEQWNALQATLAAGADQLASGGGEPLGDRTFAAPLPRAWQWLDGSAFPSHGAMMQKAFHLPPIETDLPLMYQGMSHQFLSGTDDVPFPSEADGIDFEGEFGIITDAVPMGVSAADAMSHIKLVVQINDWSLRAIAPIEMKTGFGWVQAKPCCSVAPVAITPDLLGAAWSNGRISLPLRVWRDGALFGEPNGSEMAFGFHELIAHAARTRSLPAGTIIGSGTVSNDDQATVGSTCISERRGAEIVAGGNPQTPFLRFGETVRMEARGIDDVLLFGILEQRIVQA